ncbi:MAG TPA: (Fe-S)-binding protein, partial [Chryseolinea sp.]|nr:(Fe-S)-binding protein [Chryseolinea sp.]
MIQQIAFIIILVAAIYAMRKRVLFIHRTINLGKDKLLKDNPGERLKNMLLVAFGQKKMFKRPVPAILHLFIYIGFLVINLEVLEFVIDGLVGTHRIFAPFLGGLYNISMNIFEFLAAAVLASCVIMLLRRNVLKLKRFQSAELTSWPRRDANIILITEIVLMVAILGMNAADQILQARSVEHYIATGPLFLSSLLTPALQNLGTSTLIFVERAAWWFHIVGILGFAIYITYSKHLHIFLAFPNTYFANLEPQGHIKNMPVVTHEVKTMLGLAEATQNAPAVQGRFGAKDINDLSWNNLLAAYACTECGRCTAECPANITGKKLSPRKIMMDTRDRMEEVGASIDKNGPGLNDGKTLLGNYITKEEINACTSCNACVEACPVMINPLEIILELRRYVAMEESG